MVARALSAAVFLAGVLFSTFALAQGELSVSDLKSELEALQSEVDTLEKSTTSPSATDATLAANKVALQASARKVFALALKISAGLQVADERITAIGPVSEAGSAHEAATVTEERQRLLTLKGEATVLLRETEGLSVRISNLIEVIAKLRTEKFVDDLLARHPVSSEVWRDARDNFDQEWRRLVFSFSNWFRILERNLAGRTLLAGALILGVAILVLVMVRLFGAPLMSRPKVQKQQPYLRRVLAALSKTVLPTVSVAACMLALYLVPKSLALLPPRVDEMLRAFAVVASVLAFVWSLTRAVLAPKRANWRVFSISETAATRLSILISVLALIYSGDYLLAEARTAMASPVAYTLLASFLTTILFAAVLGLVLLTPVSVEPPDTAASRSRGWPAWIYWPMWLAIVAIVAAALAGYVSLARFLAGQIVVTGAILVAMYIGYLSARAVAGTGALGRTGMGTYLSRKLQFSNLAVDQLGLVVGALLLGATLAVGIPSILLQWGFQQDDVASWFTRVFSGVSVGDVQIGIGNIVLAIVAFIVGLVLTRMFQRWLGQKVLTRTRLDSGAKHSISAGVGYVGFILAVVIALDYTGIDLSNLALIAGALSVGIGFGLQNVVNNFVSGVILLVERPIRVGDWIVVGDKQGFVRKISVRATELETFDRQSIVIPNAELINTAVGNWMLKDNIGRLIVEVGVSYDADEEEVRDVLYRLIENDDRIAEEPKPYVYFKDFGDSALIFELRVFLKDVSQIIVVGGDMRFAIRKAFRESGIVIPYPQRDIHIQGGSTVEVAEKKK